MDNEKIVLDNGSRKLQAEFKVYQYLGLKKKLGGTVCAFTDEDGYLEKAIYDGVLDFNDSISEVSMGLKIVEELDFLIYLPYFDHWFVTKEFNPRQAYY